MSRGASTTKRLHRRIVQTESILTTVRIGKVRMIENIKELSPDLRVNALAKMKVLGHRKIEVAETRVRKRIA